MGPGDPITIPLDWNCAFAKEPISFGINYPIGHPWAFGSVIDVDGKAAFTNDVGQNVHPYGPPCKYFYTPEGLSPGLYDNEIHVVTSIGTDGTIYTTTPFVGDENRTNSVCFVNLTYRLRYGLPDPSASTTFIDIKPLYKIDGTMMVNLSEYLKSIFPDPIPTPVLGEDANLYNYFTCEIIGSQDYSDWCDTFSVDMEAEIFSFTQSFVDTVHAVVRGCMDHQTFIDTYVTPAPVPIGNDPVIFVDGVTVFTVVDTTSGSLKNIISYP